MTAQDGDIVTGTRMADYDYDLPEELIAQVPLDDRSSSRLLVIDRATGELTHSVFSRLGDYLQPDDLLVLNDSRVIPARLRIRRESGGGGELLLLQRTEKEREWLALARPTRKLRTDETVDVLPISNCSDFTTATIREKLGDGTVRVRLASDLDRDLSGYGSVPLPPYITQALRDPERYQTVYSEQLGSAAAPTAGLHFTADMLDGIQRNGTELAHVTLHVGLDTFRPVTEELAEEHSIHSEWCSVSQATMDAIRRCRARGGRIIAVGTTSARTLETLGQRMFEDDVDGFSGPTDIFITPGYQWTLVDGMITNFHLPKSTLLLMVSSFASRELILRAYREAIEQRYRFFSFGDATIIL